MRYNTCNKHYKQYSVSVYMFAFVCAILNGKIRKKSITFFRRQVTKLRRQHVVPWLEARLSPPARNFVDLPILKVHCFRNILSVVCTLAVGDFSRNRVPRSILRSYLKTRTMPYLSLQLIQRSQIGIK
jgi:hypothetical protein